MMLTGPGRCINVPVTIPAMGVVLLVIVAFLVTRAGVLPMLPGIAFGIVAVVVGVKDARHTRRIGAAIQVRSLRGMASVPVSGTVIGLHRGGSLRRPHVDVSLDTTAGEPIMIARFEVAIRRRPGRAAQRASAALAVPVRRTLA